MRMLLACCLLLTMGTQAWSLGSPVDSMIETTGTINQVTIPTAAEQTQDKRWEQEEEDLDLTEAQHYEIQKQEELKREEEGQLEETRIDNYRYDEPDRKTYREKNR